MYVKYALAVLTALLVVSSGAFVVDAGGGERLRPVPFAETVEMGLTGVDVQRARAAGYEVPTAQVYYSGYRYVVGYYGIGTLVSELDREGRERQFGRPLAVFVVDYAGAHPRLTDRGFVELPGGRTTGWVPASEAVYVVGSRARTPAGPATLPFSSREAARAFAGAYGGRVVDWATARDRLAGAADVGDEARTAVRERAAWANRTIGRTDGLLDRPVSVVVGEDEPTLAAAVRAAPPNTTVLVPPGTYAANVTVRKPLTVRGAGPNATRLRGDGTGTVLRLFAPRSAVSSLSIDGVGPTGTRQRVPNRSSNLTRGWDTRVLAAYGYGDAGIAVEAANGSLVHRVRIDTPSNGVLIRFSDRVAVRETTVSGADGWREGFMDAVAMHSRIVVQNSTFRGGRDGLYTHRAHGLVVRDSRMSDLRFGVHEMYTSRALVRNNTVRRAQVGIIVMTRPAGNAVVGNDVRASEGGISIAGSASHVAGNVVAGNDVGLWVNARRTRYERNTVAANGVGIRADTVLPTNRVVANDVVANDRQVVARGGPVHLWAAGERGNYWGPLPALDRDGDGVYDREYRPTGVVDAHVGRSPGASTLARSPAVGLLRELQAAVPGLRAAGVVDEAPLAGPVRPAALDGVNATVVDGDYDPSDEPNRSMARSNHPIHPGDVRP